MQDILKKIILTPYYSQIFIQIPGWKDYPQFEGGEKYVINKGCIVVATTPDHLGDVTIEIHSTFMKAPRDAIFLATFYLEKYVPKIEIGEATASEGKYANVPLGCKGFDIHINRIENPDYITLIPKF